ncbi:acyl-CoA thioesterase II [Methylocystis bryophila]|uniref:Acyl-CoA thioesterase 2 n=1 Tax=Methylocystis bryophila TaxID=655015 RepID=A0A1W6MXR3_9HYPH|nr:acyl-CoA thioesterase II [Methylocystis bryophila]ARN82388.1 acyl-CoA thioesterase II [Methylocystis bryophila]BDV38559.1 acyl-CoA thioesterase II [Methylocystis bryophila]
MAINASLDELLRLLDLETLGEDRFRGFSPANAPRAVYGGQAIAQALVAAQRTVPADRPVHSLHGYFILAGDPKTPIDYSVERVRDGRSFTTRRCAARQNGQTIFSLEASFQIVEEGFDHAIEMPEVPSPESLPTSSALADRLQSFLPQGVLARLQAPSALDMRVVDPAAAFGMTKPGSVRQYFWFRIGGPLSDDDALHRALLAYLSDMTLLNTALAIHGRTIFERSLQVASLDHALWFHRPFRADEWLLYAQESPSASGARALTRGALFTREGRLVASVAQEGLIRQRDQERR